jgi:hypothetical protein
MKKEADSPFSPVAIAKIVGRRFRSIASGRGDQAQRGPKPSDFGDHEPIPEEAMVQLSLGPKDLSASKIRIDPSICGEKE